MKPHFDPIIVVEGTSDVAFLLSFLDADIVSTNGSDVPRETIDYLLEASKMRDIVVLTDPDAPGNRIRDVLNQYIPNLKHAYIPKESAIKHDKVGVAESSKDVVLEALGFALSQSHSNFSSLSMIDMLELGLMGAEDSSKKRETLSKALHLGHANAKTMLKRMNAIGITRTMIEEALKDE